MRMGGENNVDKDFLIKSVAQDILVYSISCFKLHQGLCEHLTMTIRVFVGK